MRVIVTGGTFDKEYDQLKGELVFRRSHVKKILDQAKVRDAAVEKVMLKDSLHMDQADRERILAACASCPEDRVVVTHGTDTMVETAGVIGRAGLAKTVVLVGAMVPYTVSGSDAGFNLGCAVAAARLLGHGVFVAMNGRVLPFDDVRKDRAAGRFEPASR